MPDTNHIVQHKYLCMAIQSLVPPQDITWTRMLFSRDMMDTNFDNLNFPPKWRTSLAVYYYIVPEEETVDAYPNSRIVYLKFTASITGWNPSESLQGARRAAQEMGTWDDLQRTLWETIVASGWARKYWPCLGAIMQLAVYPDNKEGVSPDDYPYIMDFEPKKRELYETFSEGSEMLSGSSDKTSLTKGSTSVNSTEYGAEAGGSFMGFGASASYQKTKTDTTINQKTTDTSREARETLSRTTSGSQLYQLFNGYHLGTNRALFVVAPRPHTVSAQEQTDFNLIDGQRKLEGIQDVLVVVHMPRSMSGFCVQASIDTGHLAVENLPGYLVARRRQDDFPDGDPTLPPNPPNPPPPTADPVQQLVVTRRIAQSCGTFDENGNFNLRQLKEPVRDLVLGEIVVADLPSRAMSRMAPAETTRGRRIETANSFNMIQSRVSRSMLDVISAGNYQQKKFEETGVFKSLVAYSLTHTRISVAQLRDTGILSGQNAELLQRLNVRTVAELFANADKLGGAEIEELRETIVSHLFKRKENR